MTMKTWHYSANIIKILILVRIVFYEVYKKGFIKRTPECGPVQVT